jgi:hypothetical protein
MKLIGKALILGIAAATASVVGCSTGPSTGSSSPGSEDSTGSIGLQLTLPGGEIIDTVAYTITGNGQDLTGTINVAASQTISFLIGGIPAGSGYTIALTATTTDGTTTCVGSTTFSVTARQTTTVDLNLQCHATAADAGSISVVATTSNCATWNSVSANPNETTVGSAVALSATAVAPNLSAITFAWSAPTGTFSAPAAPNTSFTSTTTGPVTVTLVVGDGPLASGGTCDTADSTVTLVVTFAAATGAVDAGAPDSGTAADSSAADTSVAADTGTPDTGAPDVGTPALAPCTTAGQTGCVPCAGNATGLCTVTEAAFVQHDITAGHATAAGGDSPTGCYSCLFNSGCLDDSVFGDTGHECGDLPAVDFGGGTALDSAVCLTTLSCILSTSCDGTPSGVSICYCGAANAGSACAAAGAGVNGACVTQEVAGLGFPIADNTDILKNFTNTALPSGQANQIFQCAISNACQACLQ